MTVDQSALDKALEDLRDVKKDLQKTKNLQTQTEKTLQEVNENLKILKEKVNKA